MAGDQPGFAEADFQLLQRVGFDVFGAAAGPEGGQIGADALEAADAFPLGAVPSNGAGDILPVLATDQGGDDFDPQAVGDIQRGVVDRGGDGFGEGRVVLGLDRQHAQACQFGENRGGEDAGRAIALDDGDQAVGGHGGFGRGHGGHAP